VEVRGREVEVVRGRLSRPRPAVTGELRAVRRDHRPQTVSQLPAARASCQLPRPRARYTASPPAQTTLAAGVADALRSRAADRCPRCGNATGVTRASASPRVTVPPATCHPPPATRPPAHPPPDAADNLDRVGAHHCRHDASPDGTPEHYGQQGRRQTQLQERHSARSRAHGSGRRPRGPNERQR
jgi:hypothetical protein